MVGPTLLLDSSAEELGLGGDSPPNADSESKLLDEPDGSVGLSVVDAEMSVKDKDPGIDILMDELLDPDIGLDVSFPVVPVIRRLLLLTGSAVSLAALEVGLLVMDGGDNSGGILLVDALMLSDGDVEPMLELEGSPVERVKRGVTNEEEDEETLVGRLDKLSNDRYDGPLGMEDAGELATKYEALLN